MIVDNIENLKKYASLHPLFNEVLDYISTTDIFAHELGRVDINGDSLYANFQQLAPKTKEEARVETHNRYIDIQIPLSDTEMMGYTPRKMLKDEAYNEEKDITFYSGEAESYMAVHKGMFVVFYPEDGHAPGITERGVRKLIFKVQV